MRIVEAYLAESQVELLTELDRARRGELLDGPLFEHAEVVERDVRAPTKKNRRLVISSSSCNRDASGQGEERAAFRLSSTLNALERAPGVTSQTRRLRSTSAAAVPSDTTIPSPSQVGRASCLAQAVGHVLPGHLDQS